MNPPDQHKTSHNFWSTVKEWTKTIIIALIIALPIRFFIAEPFIVSGASMDPTFASGQFLIVDRLTYRFEEPKRGDVIIFEYPNDPSVYFIKRIIGLPGETVEVNNGQITIINSENPNGFKITEPYIQSARASHDNFTKKLNDTEYFVMGDNRLQSSDSRLWGPLDKHFIIGRPIIRLLPFNAVSVFPGQYHK